MTLLQAIQRRLSVATVATLLVGAVLGAGGHAVVAGGPQQTCHIAPGQSCLVVADVSPSPSVGPSASGASSPTPSPSVSPSATPTPKPTPSAIANLQSALNATASGQTLDAGGQAFSGSHFTIPAGVTLANAKLTYTGGAGATQSGFVDLSAGSVLTNSTVVGSGLAYATVRVWVGATNAQLLGDDISGGRYLGVIAYQANGLLVSGGRIHDNNAAGGQEGYEAGGIKIGNSSPYTVTGVDVDTNKGPGIWCDVGCSGGHVTNNRVFANTYAGIMDEISFGTVITGNDVWEDGWGDSRSAFNGGILLSSTAGALVTGNLVAWCPEGIAAISQAGRSTSVAGTSATGNAILVSAGHTAVQTYAESGAPSNWGPWAPNSTATVAQLAAAGMPTAPQPGH